MEWILTTDSLPESGTQPYRCKPVIARVLAQGDNHEDVAYCWLAIRCTDHDSVVRWYGLDNNGHCVNDNPRYEEILDESVLAWVPWPEFQMTTDERVLAANKRMNGEPIERHG